MICRNRTCMSLVSLIVAALAVLAPSRSSLANETLWEPLWKSAFQQDYVPGRSGMMLGAELAPGVYELVVYNAAPGDIQTSTVGAVTIHGTWDLLWHTPVSTTVDTSIDGLPVTGAAGATFTSMSATISTFTGFTAWMAGLGMNLSVQVQVGGVSADDAASVFAPTSVYSTVEKASAAAFAFAQGPTIYIPFIPVSPGDDSPEGCAARCWNTYAQDFNTAINTLDGKLDNCGFLRGLAGGGLASCLACSGGGVAGCAICGIVGGALGAGYEWTKCRIDAYSQANIDITNAKIAYAACMANCGFVVAWE